METVKQAIKYGIVGSGEHRYNSCRYLDNDEAARLFGYCIEYSRLCGGGTEQFYLEQAMDVP